MTKQSVARASHTHTHVIDVRLRVAFAFYDAMLMQWVVFLCGLILGLSFSKANQTWIPFKKGWPRVLIVVGHFLDSFLLEVNFICWKLDSIATFLD